MSLVGPRPEMPAVAAQADGGFVAERLAVRPGCTGLWQISTGSDRLIHESPEYDLFYVRNWTVRLDIWVLLRTVSEVLGGTSIGSVNEIPAWALAEIESDREPRTPAHAAEPAIIVARPGLTRVASFVSEHRPTNGTHVVERPNPMRGERDAPRAAAK